MLIGKMSEPTMSDREVSCGLQSVEGISIGLTEKTKPPGLVSQGACFESNQNGYFVA